MWNRSAMEVNNTPQQSQFHHDLGKNNSGQDFGYPEEELFYTIALCAANICLSLTAVIGNVLVLITIWKTSSLHSAANILLANLAVSDLTVGLAGHPLFIVALLIRIYNRTLSLGLWVAFNTLISFLCGASFFTITAIGVDRLLALELHFRYEALVTPFRVIWVVIFTWVVSGIFSTIRLWATGLSFNALSPIIFTLLVGNSVVYLKIYLIVRGHLAQIQSQPLGCSHNRSIFSIQRFKRSALNTFLLYILLLCCYRPKFFRRSNHFS